MTPNRRTADDDRAKLVTAIVIAMRAENGVADELHAKHHAYIDMLIDRDTRKKERWDTIKTQVGGWGVIAFLGAVGTGAWMVFKVVLMSIPR